MDVTGADNPSVCTIVHATFFDHLGSLKNPTASATPLWAIPDIFSKAATWLGFYGLDLFADPILKRA